jgi:GT2 family glycosyltransferase
MHDIAVCVATYGRPFGLKRLLESFDQLKYEDGLISIFVADNDGEQHAGFDYVEANRARHRHPILCEIEARPGISFARNRCLAMVSRSARIFSYIAFTDDDIAVCQNWMSDLVRTAKIYHAPVVFGKREPRFEHVPADEILNSDFFKDEFDCPVTGTKVFEGPTCNMLVETQVFEKIGYAPFDSNLSLSGGEDIDICIQMQMHGFRFVSCASAVCYEFFPNSRLNAQWITSRYFRTGSTYGYMRKKYKSAAAFYFGVFKKILVLGKLYVVFLVHGDLASKCRLYNTLGFFYFLKRGDSFQEYQRKS